MVEIMMILLSCINPTNPKLAATRSAWHPMKLTLRLSQINMF